MKAPDKFQTTIRQIRTKPKNRLQAFKSLLPAQQAQACLMLSKHLVYDILCRLDDLEIASILENLDPGEATDVLQLFPQKKQTDLLEILSSRIKGAVERLLGFDPKTAAGLMNVDYIQVNDNDTIAEVAKQFKVHEKRTGRLPTIIVLKSGAATGQLAGYFPGHELGFAHPKDKAKKYVRKIPTIHHASTYEEAIDLFRAYPHSKIAVLGGTGNVLGIIYSDDIARVLREQTAASLYDFAGVSREESVFASALEKIKFRYKWLIVNLCTAFLAAFVVSLFDQTIAKYVLLAVYMPIIAGMGGNAGVQAMAVMVRAITLKQIDLKSSFGALKNELVSGFVNGAINGALVAMVILFANRDPMLALVLFLAMIISLVVAGAAGTLVPLLMVKLGKDPASSATIFITTATDVLGFFAFLGLATLLLP